MALINMILKITNRPLALEVGTLFHSKFIKIQFSTGCRFTSPACIMLNHTGSMNDGMTPYRANVLESKPIKA